MTEARFVHIVDEVPELGGRSDGPVLVTALDGFLDAGNASALTVGHLTASDDGRVVAVFDVDEFYDYRARRPPLTFVEDHYADYEAPRLVVRLMEDEHGSPYLLLTGPEPDTRWEAYARAVRSVVEHFQVRLVVSMGSVPMAVPHTRPVQLTNHATARRLLVQENVWRGEIRVPASAQSLAELRLGEWGHDAMGFVAHIPHYVAQFDYPQASVALLEGIEDVTGLQWDQARSRRQARPDRWRSTPRSRTPTRSAMWSPGWSSSTTPSTPRRPTCSPRMRPCRAVRRSAPSSSSSSPSSRNQRTR